MGINGGEPGSCSSKTLIKKDGTKISLASKIDDVKVEKGDQILFITAGSGGWGDPLDRPAEKVHSDVMRGLVSKEKALKSYGVHINENQELDMKETEAVRAKIKLERGTLESFNFGERKKQVYA